MIAYALARGATRVATFFILSLSFVVYLCLLLVPYSSDCIYVVYTVGSNSTAYGKIMLALTSPVRGKGRVKYCICTVEVLFAEMSLKWKMGWKVR